MAMEKLHMVKVRAIKKKGNKYPMTIKSIWAAVFISILSFYLRIMAFQILTLA